MSLHLPSDAPAWLPLARGVSVLHRPATQAEVSAARAWARQRAQRAEAALRDAALERLGEAPADPTPEERGAVVAGYTVIGLGRLCITEWRGVDQACTPEAVEQLLTLPDMAAAYVGPALSLVRGLDAEGNGSAPAPNGTMAGAPNTATDAAPQA